MILLRTFALFCPPWPLINMAIILNYFHFTRLSNNAQDKTLQIIYGSRQLVNFSMYVHIRISWAALPFFNFRLRALDTGWLKIFSRKYIIGLRSGERWRNLKRFQGQEELYLVLMCGCTLSLSLLQPTHHVHVQFDLFLTCTQQNGICWKTMKVIYYAIPWFYLYFFAKNKLPSAKITILLNPSSTIIRRQEWQLLQTYFVLGFIYSLN